MKFQLVLLLFLAVLSLMALLVVEAKSCKGLKNIERKSCLKNNRRGSKNRSSNSKGGRRKQKAPYWRRGPPKEQQITARQGSKVTMTCAIKGSPGPSFQWMRHNKLLSKKTDYGNLTFKRHRLHIKDVQKVDMGNYTCVAKNKHGQLGFNFTVRVLDEIIPPDIDIVDRPQNQTSQVGDTVIFQCRSRDWPRPMVFWGLNKNNVLSDIKPFSRANDSSILVLENVTKENSGEYFCLIGNESRHLKLTATLTVINEGEKLPFEPPCSLHVRRQNLTDDRSGCKTSEPVPVHYCMGSCGRSYFIPQMITDGLPLNQSFLQTCGCCIGVAESVRVVNLVCPLGQTKSGFYLLLTRCVCSPCKTDEPIAPPATTEHYSLD